MFNPIELAETGFVPDWIVRRGIRRLLAKRRHQPHATSVAEFASQLRAGPLAIETHSANEQHYEVPAEFFEACLGPRLKYSCCWFSDPSNTLAVAEEQMLRLTCQRAEIENGMRILELGCGWGSLTLWMAEHFRDCPITAVSNSHGQRRYIEAQAQQRGLSNICVITADMRDFSIDEKFERIVSVEMFEHMRNYELLFSRLAKWLMDDGKVFVHIFCHRDTPYLFETDGPDDWMGRHFFTGGVMPSEDLFQHFDQCLAIDQQWTIDGKHYWRTCEAWLRNLDRNRAVVLEGLRRNLSRSEARRQLQRWRMFFMACAELFRYRGGQEWFVAHYLFEHRLAANYLRKSRHSRVAMDR